MRAQAGKVTVASRVDHGSHSCKAERAADRHDLEMACAGRPRSPHYDYPTRWQHSTTILLPLRRRRDLKLTARFARIPLFATLGLDVDSFQLGGGLRYVLKSPVSSVFRVAT